MVAARQLDSLVETDSGFGRHVHAGCLVVTFEVEFDEVALLEGVLD
jgi:hypothetical protein